MSDERVDERDFSRRRKRKEDHSFFPELFVG